MYSSNVCRENAFENGTKSPTGERIESDTTGLSCGCYNDMDQKEIWKGIKINYEIEKCFDSS